MFTEDPVLWFIGTLFKRGYKEAFEKYWGSEFALIASIESDLMEIIGQVWDIRRQMESEIIPYSMTKVLLMMRVLSAVCALEMRMQYEGDNTVL